MLYQVIEMGFKPKFINGYYMGVTGKINNELKFFNWSKVTELLNKSDDAELSSQVSNVTLLS